MPNGGFIPDWQFKEWEQAFAPYEKAIEEFVREKGIRVEKWFHDMPTWHIGRDQKIDDLNVVWWSIQLNYDQANKKFNLWVVAWLDREYQASGRPVRERRLSPLPTTVATWKVGKKKLWMFSLNRVNIKKLLDKAYRIATSFTEEDLTQVSASIQGNNGAWRHYDPQGAEGKFFVRDGNVYRMRTFEGGGSCTESVGPEKIAKLSVDKDAVFATDAVVTLTVKAEVWNLSQRQYVPVSCPPTSIRIRLMGRQTVLGRIKYNQKKEQKVNLKKAVRGHLWQRFSGHLKLETELPGWVNFPANVLVI